jgi:adenosylcobinamide-phosphate synthase
LIIIPILAVILAIAIDFALGDPRNKYHPTVWIGTLIGKLVPLVRSTNTKLEKMGGFILVISITTLVSVLVFAFNSELQQLESLNFVGLSKILVIIITILSVGFLLKTTIAIKGMEQHASKIMNALLKNDLEDARAKLSMIVKRNTKNLDRQHITSATLESISENTVDGITGPLFYFAILGLVGSFVYRTVNTIDSMIGYKTVLFRNLGWFGANCDKILNFVPSRLTSLIMILASMIVGGHWRDSLEIMRRDGPKTESPNAGYPMATMAGALGVRFEKLDHYTLGDGISEITEKHIKTAISIMKITTILFVVLFTIPMIVILSYLGWWNFV